VPDRFSPAPPREQAVIDIGSNSVRLVVYRMAGRANAPVLNEKVLAGLGRGMVETGTLHPVGARRALEAIDRFKLLIDAMGITQVEAVATAAVRAASDGQAFVTEIQKRTGIDVRIISGREEGRLSALGVLAGAPGASGVAGDLGGSSLELVTLNQTGPSQAESWQLGPFAMGKLDPFDGAQARKAIDQVLSRSDVLASTEGGEFHAVGGAWRALAKIDMILRDYPLKVLHNYAMTRSDALNVCAFVSGQSRQSLEKTDGSIGKRAETLPYAATLLQALLEAAPFDQVVISSHGLREGLLFEQLSQAERAQDPLVAGAIAMVGADPRASAFGEALFWWITPIFEDLPPLFSDNRGSILRAAACILTDIGATLHPDDRAKIAFDLVLRAPYPAASHMERVFLARTLARRYGAKLDEVEPVLVRRLLDEERLARAEALGAALRLGADLSGRSASLLGRCRIAHENGVLTLSTTPALKGLFAEQAVKRLEQLGKALKTPVAVRVG
jgi:exopolyphosphatase / guanosine-5'-triphosphate,3'-diphosphate pyrophosphatase